MQIHPIIRVSLTVGASSAGHGALGAASLQVGRDNGPLTGATCYYFLLLVTVLAYTAFHLL